VLAAVLKPAQREAARLRTQSLRAEKEKNLQAHLEKDRSIRNENAVCIAARFMEELGVALPKDCLHF